jgi:hypothetical protein
MGSVSIWHWLIVILLFVVLVVPSAVIPMRKILTRAGFSGWLVIPFLIPLVNVAAMWWFAYAPWPIEQKP